MSAEDGLSYFLERHLVRIPAIQSSWLDAGETVLSTLLQDEAMLSDLFLKKLQLPVSRRFFTAP